MLESVLDCVGGEVPAVQSAVTVDASVQALMPGNGALLLKPWRAASQIKGRGLKTAYLLHLGIACLFTPFLDDRRAIWILKALWQVPASGELRTCVCGYKACIPARFRLVPFSPRGLVGSLTVVSRLPCEFWIVFLLLNCN